MGMAWAKPTENYPVLHCISIIECFSILKLTLLLLQTATLLFCLKSLPEYLLWDLKPDLYGVF